MPGMGLALTIFGTAFAAFCVWIAVRIVSRRERWAEWTAVAILVIGPVLYVLSSGPMKMVGWRSQKNPPVGIPIPMPAPRRVLIEYVIVSEWWHRTYAPLFWASKQSWGGPVNTYWELFPARREPE